MSSRDEKVDYIIDNINYIDIHDRQSVLSILHSNGFDKANFIPKKNSIIIKEICLSNKMINELYLYIQKKIKDNSII
jgi:hypothetical protein